MAGKIGRSIPDHIYRALLARSGNKCAYTGCTRPIVSSTNVYEAQLCHIESVSHKKQRFNPNLSEEEVNGYNNLMFMCYKHHIETNDETVYTTEVLRKMKYDHESKYVISPYNVDMSHVYTIKRESEEYWQKIEFANNNEHLIPDLKVEINTKAEYEELNNSICETLNQLDSLIDIIEKKDKTKYWEVFNIGIPNSVNKIRVLLDHMSIKYFETYLTSNPQDAEVKNKLDKLRNEFLETSRTSGYFD